MDVGRRYCSAGKENHITTTTSESLWLSILILGPTTSKSILDLFSIKDKNVIITSATGGIGFEITVALAEAGADIVSIEMPRDPGSADLRRAVEATGRPISDPECNLKDPQSIKDTFAALWKAGVVPDILSWLTAPGLRDTCWLRIHPFKILTM
jgi:2-deoxy-D-gluconate 3-dehydrogenase